MKKRLLPALSGTAGLAGMIALGAMMSANAAGPIQVAQADPDPALFAALMDEGEVEFDRNCAGCHGDEGEGGGTGPRLAGNQNLSSNTFLVSQIINGYEDHGMPPFNHLDDRTIQAIATYVRNSWGNDFGITPFETVGANREE